MTPAGIQTAAETGPDESREKQTRIAVVTGAGGFLGRHVCRHLVAAGWCVRGLVRDVGAARGAFSEAGLDVELKRCMLPDVLDPAHFAGAALVVHCAYGTRHPSEAEAERVNVVGSQRVRELARASGAQRFVFVSSTSADPQYPSYYGRSKHAVEALCDADADLIIRPGLILGPDGGLFQRIAGTIRRLPIVPVIDGDVEIQTVHVDDVCAALLRAVERGLTGAYTVAEPEGIRLRELFRSVAEKSGLRRWFVDVPMLPVVRVLQACERLGLRLPVTSENAMGLRALAVWPCEADIARIGVRVRSAGESLDDLLG